MNQMCTFFVLAVFASQVYAAPQFITFKDGKLGVNFGGYHAAVGVGGGQGLFAEAGTPHGQQASAGLGGAMGGNGNTGGLFAGATAGNGIGAAAGLGGSTNGQNSAGGGYATAQYGNRFAVAGLGGEASENGSSGVKFAGTNVATPVITDIKTVVPVKPNIENEIEGFENVLPINSAHVDVNIGTRSDVNIPVVEKEVSTWGFHRDYRNYNTPFTFQTVMNSVFSKPGYLHPPLARPRFQVHRYYQVRPVDTVVEKLYYKEKPSHNVHKSVSYFDVNAQRNSDAEFAATENVGNGGQVTVNKEIHLQRNPNYFSDIFNIPITALRAVSDLLGTTADSTKVSVQKTASIGHDAEIGSRNAYEPSSASSGVSGGHQITVQSQQTASDFFGNIFAIPINTLGAVNKFLENNVPARKRIQVTQAGDHNIEASATAGLHLGPHARRRAAKRLLFEASNGNSEAQ